MGESYRLRDPRVGAGKRTRTADLLITNQLLYQLSYPGTGTILPESHNIFGGSRESFWFSGLLYDRSSQYEPCQAMTCRPFSVCSHKDPPMDNKLDSQNNILYPIENI